MKKEDAVYLQVAHLVFFLLLLFDDKFLEYKFILNKSNKKMYGFAKFTSQGVVFL